MVAMIAFGHKRLEIDLPEEVTLDIREHIRAGPGAGYESFRECLVDAERELFPVSEADLFIVNDAYRPTPTARILDWLDRAGRLPDQARFLVATGCHQAPDRNQLAEIFGGRYESLSDRVAVHDARDEKAMVTIGDDGDGFPVAVNRLFMEARRPVIIGSVEPHYFAGFTGGRKSLFPGLGDYATTVRNHNRAVSFEARPLKLEANPVEEHLQSLMKILPPKDILGIQVVMGGRDRIHSLFCGPLHRSFGEACRLCRTLYGFSVENEYDLILAEVRPPLDANLYQLQKSLENCQAAIADGGTVILFSPCHEGIGPDEFYRLANIAEPPEGKKADSGNDFGRHKLYRVRRIADRINVYLHSLLSTGIPEKVFFRTAREPQKIIDELTETNKYLRVALVRDAGHTVLAHGPA